MREYKGLYEFADNEEDNTKVVNWEEATGGTVASMGKAGVCGMYYHTHGQELICDNV